jgi:hypothetical protein
MSERTPQQYPDPNHPDDFTGADPSLVDLIAGDPPVPITVWRTARTDQDTGSIPSRLAYRLVSSYSRPGEAVVDVTNDHALAAVCAAGARPHHQARFTDDSLVIAPPTPTDQPETPADADDDVPELAAWFGDDLTDPDLPPYLTLPPAQGFPHPATSLVVAGWPLHAAHGPNQARLARLLTAGAQLLRPSGCLVLVVAPPPGEPAVPEDFTPVVAAAQQSGLSYLQHIVAVTADTDGDAFVYHLVDEELLALAHPTGERWAMAHLRVHCDLLVFAQPDQPQPVRGQRGGRRG